MIGIRGVHTTKALAARGMSPGALRHAVATGTLVRLRRGVYCDAELWRESEGRAAARHAIEVCAAWHALGERGWAAGYSAALLADLPVPAGQPGDVVFTLPRRWHGRRVLPGLRLRTASVEPTDVTVLRAVPAARPARAALDVAREFGFAAGLAVADAGLRRGAVGPGELSGIAARMARWSGGRQACLVGAWANGARESPAESLSYAAFVQAGIALPECNAWVLGSGAGGVRADFLWRRFRLVGEVDGRIKYTEQAWRPAERVLVEEKQRQLRLEEAGFVVVRWTGAEAMYHPDVVLDRIIRHAALAADRLGVPALTIPARGTVKVTPWHAECE